jgi:hypothetical protein
MCLYDGLWMSSATSSTEPFEIVFKRLIIKLLQEKDHKQLDMVMSSEDKGCVERFFLAKLHGSLHAAVQERVVVSILVDMLKDKDGMELCFQFVYYVASCDVIISNKLIDHIKQLKVLFKIHDFLRDGDDELDSFASGDVPDPDVGRAACKYFKECIDSR